MRTSLLTPSKQFDRSGSRTKRTLASNEFRQSCCVIHSLDQVWIESRSVDAFCLTTNSKHSSVSGTLSSRVTSYHAIPSNGLARPSKARVSKEICVPGICEPFLEIAKVDDFVLQIVSRNFRYGGLQWSMVGPQEVLQAIERFAFLLTNQILILEIERSVMPK